MRWIKVSKNIPLKEKVSCYVQQILWNIGIHWHNTVRDECTPDFSCCIKKEKKDEQWK